MSGCCIEQRGRFRSLLKARRSFPLLPDRRGGRGREGSRLAVGRRAQGRLRITSCGTIGRTVIVPVVAKLLRENPKLEIDLVITDELLDVVSTGIDVAVRIADLKDSGLTGTVVGKNPRSLYAAPAYLSAREPPRHIDDLAAHECLLLSGARHWHFMVSGRDAQLPVSVRLTATTIEGLHDACLEATGIAVLSKWRAEVDVAAGRLVPISLEDAEPKEHTIHLSPPIGRSCQRSSYSWML